MSDVTGVILAGGKSSRMGRNKATLPVNSENADSSLLIEVIAQRMQKIFPQCILSARDSETEIDLPDLPVVFDHYPDTGPLGAIASVLEAGYSPIFCVACDMPFLNEALIRYICEFADCDAVIPVWHGQPEVLHALYSSRVLEFCQSAIQEGRYRVTDAIVQANIKYIQMGEIKKFDRDGRSFDNLNTPQDYERFLREFGG